jgi:hypothetical protein
MPVAHRACASAFRDRQRKDARAAVATANAIMKADGRVTPARDDRRFKPAGVFVLSRLDINTR